MDSGSKEGGFTLWGNSENKITEYRIQQEILKMQITGSVLLKERTKMSEQAVRRSVFPSEFCGRDCLVSLLHSDIPAAVIPDVSDSSE